MRSADDGIQSVVLYLQLSYFEDEQLDQVSDGVRTESIGHLRSLEQAVRDLRQRLEAQGGKR